MVDSAYLSRVAIRGGAPIHADSVLHCLYIPWKFSVFADVVCSVLSWPLGCRYSCCAVCSHGLVRSEVHSPPVQAPQSALSAAASSPLGLKRSRRCHSTLVVPGDTSTACLATRGVPCAAHKVRGAESTRNDKPECPTQNDCVYGLRTRRAPQISGNFQNAQNHISHACLVCIQSIIDPKSDRSIRAEVS